MITVRSRPRDSAALAAMAAPTPVAPAVTPISSAPVASARRRASSMATGSYALRAGLARDQSTVPSAPTEASSGSRVHL